MVTHNDNHNAHHADPLTPPPNSHKKSKWQTSLKVSLLRGCCISAGQYENQPETPHSTMGSSSHSSNKQTLDAKSKDQRDQRHRIGESAPNFIITAMAKIKKHKRRQRRREEAQEEQEPQPCVFEGMTPLERMYAYQYYYDHPEELPDRESDAMRMAGQRPKTIKVQFDLGIWERETPLRVVDEDDLYGSVDPLEKTPRVPDVGERLREKRIARSWTRTRSNSV